MLLTKLHIPPAGNNTVHRSELFEKLNTGLSRKLILISAPAGFGKTTVVSDWIEQNKIPTAWFSIDKADNDPVEFLNYIIAGIKSIHSTFGQTATGLLNSPSKPSIQSIVSLLINDILHIKFNFLLNVFRLNLSVSYKFNKPGATHEIFLDLMNLTNSQARIAEYYDVSKPDKTGYREAFGFFPNLMYRVYF